MVPFQSSDSNMSQNFLLQVQHYCSYSLIYDATFERDDDVLHFPYQMEFEYDDDEEDKDDYQQYIRTTASKSRLNFDHEEIYDDDRGELENRKERILRGII